MGLVGFDLRLKLHGPAIPFMAAYLGGRRGICEPIIQRLRCVFDEARQITTAEWSRFLEYHQPCGHY